MSKTETPSIPSPSVSFYFNEKLKPPKEFDKLSPDMKVKVIVNGKISGFSNNRESQSLSLDINGVDLEIKELPRNLREARKQSMEMAEKSDRKG